MAPPAFAVPAGPKNIPPHRCGPAMQAPTSKRQGLCKNSIALSKFHRRGEHCSPVKALCCRKAPRVEQSPTPTICRERVLINFSVISQFCRRGGAWLRPPLPYPLAQKIYLRTVAGLPCRPLQAKGKAYAKILSLFQSFIVGASIARPLKPCDAAKPFGWSRAPPLQYAARECV